MTGRELTFLWITLEVNRQFGAQTQYFWRCDHHATFGGSATEQTTHACVLLTGRTTFDGSIMNQSEFRNYHEREAARLRALLAVLTRDRDPQQQATCAQRHGSTSWTGSAVPSPRPALWVNPTQSSGGARNAPFAFGETAQGIALHLRQGTAWSQTARARKSPPGPVAVLVGVLCGGLRKCRNKWPRGSAPRGGSSKLGA